MHSYEFLGNKVIRTYAGIVTTDEIIEGTLDLIETPELEQVRYVINDFTDAEKILIDASQVKSLVQTDAIAIRSYGFMKVVIIASNPDTVKLAEYYCDLIAGETIESRVFATIELALEWIEEDSKTELRQ